MEENKRKEDLSKNETIDEGYFDFITDLKQKKVGKSSKKSKEETLRKKARNLLETKYDFSSKQILEDYFFEIDNDIFRPDLVVVDEKTKENLIVVELSAYEKTISLTKRQLKQNMDHLNASYGIIITEKEPEFYQKTNEVLIPIANIPKKSQIKEKSQPVTINQEIAETIAYNLADILRSSSYFGIDAVGLSLQILLVKNFDELKHNNAYFKDSKNTLSSLNTFETLWGELEKSSNEKFITKNYFENLGNHTAEQLFSFIREFSISNSDISSLFKYLIRNISSDRKSSIASTPDHLLDLMYELGSISMKKHNHMVVTSSGESVLQFISFIESNLKFSKNEVSSFLENNTTFSVENEDIFNILSLFSILSGKLLRLGLEGIIGREYDEHAIYDSVIIDGLISRKASPIEQKEFHGLDFIDVLLSQSIKTLRPNGRLIALVPKTYLFQKKSYRHHLLEECSVRAIIELPIMGTSYNNLNSALVVFEKNKVGKPIFMAHHGTVERSFFNPYDSVLMEKIFNKFKEFEKTGSLSDQDDSGFLVSLPDLVEDWTASRKSPSFREKISKIKHPVYLRDVISTISGNPLKTSDRRKIPYILISDFDDLSQKKIIEKAPQHLPPNINPKYLTKEGDILLSRAGTIGKTAIITKENENQLVIHGIAILRIKNKEMNPLHLKNELEKKFVQEQFKSYAQSTYNFYLNTEMIGKVIINLPNAEEQQKLGSKIHELESQINEHKEEISKLEEKLKKLKEE